MFKSFSLSLVILLILIAIVPAVAQAQDEAEGVLPACTEEEVAAVEEGLAEVDQTFADAVVDFDLTSDPTDNAYGVTIVALEALSASYWSEFYPEVPECAEAQAVAFTVGMFFDQYLTIALLVNAAAWQDAAGNADNATAFADQAAARLEALEALQEEMGEMSLSEYAATLLTSDLPACTEEEMAAAGEALGTAFEEIGALAEEAGDPAILFALTEGFSYAFWDEAYDALATCAENESVAWEIGLILDQANIIGGLYANSAAEAEGGNADVSTALLDAASAREEYIAAMMSGE